MENIVYIKVIYGNQGKRGTFIDTETGDSQMRTFDTDSIMGISRRSFMGRFSAGLAGASALAFAGRGDTTEFYPGTDFNETSFPEAPEAHVTLLSGTDRRGMVAKALAPYADTIRQAIGNKRILIKLNCNRPDVQLIKTHPDAVRGVLDVITPFYDRTIYVGEATSASVPATATFGHFGYYNLEREYNVKMIELNDEPVTEQWILNRDLFPEKIYVQTPFLDPDVYLISVAPLKTHDTVIATLSLKNVVMGAPQRKFKGRMHGQAPEGSPSFPNSPKLLQVNMFKVAHSIRPDLAVLDGVVGAEGNGPNHCDPVDHRVVLAGTDFVAVDLVGAELMGIPWRKMAYLHYCALAGFGQGDKEKIHVHGEDPADHIVSYKLHDRAQWQLQWDKPIDWGLIHPKR